MPEYEVLFVIEIVYVLLISLLLIVKQVKFKKLFDINNILIASISLVPSLTLALISLVLNQAEGLEKVFLIFSSFSIPITFFFVIVILEQYSKMKEILENRDEKN